MGLTASEFADLLSKNVHRWVMESYAMTPVVYPMLTRQVSPGDFGRGPDDQWVKWGTGLGAGSLRERRPGQEYLADSGAQDFTKLMRRRQFYKKLVINKEDLAAMDSARAISMIRAMSANWGQQLAFSKEKLCADFFLNGSLTAGHSPTFDQTVPSDDNLAQDPYPKVGYDGYPLFDTTHPRSRQDSTNQYSNHLASTAFSYDNLQTAWTLITDTNAYDGRGDRIQVQPNLLVHGPSLRFSVQEALLSPGDPGSGNRRANVDAMMNLQPLEWRYLTGTNAGAVSVASGWFLLQTGPEADVLFVDEWKAPEEVMDVDSSFGRVSYQMEWFFGIGQDNWRRSLCCNIAAA